MNRDKDNNSAVISLGEMYSDSTAPHLSSAGSPPPPANGAAADEVTVHRATVYRCGSPPTGRSVSFMCGHGHRSETDGSGSARASGRRQSVTVGEQKETSAAVTSVVSLSVNGSPSTQHHIEDEKSDRLKSVGTDTMTAATCLSGVSVCKCVNSPLSQFPDVESGRPVNGSGHAAHEGQPTCDVEIDETKQSHIFSKQTAAPECCVIHVSSSN